MVQNLHFYFAIRVQTRYDLFMDKKTEDLKYLRLKAELTQVEAAELCDISLRSYKSYENDTRKQNTPLYKYLVDVMEKKALVDEEHGLLTIETIKEKCKSVLNNYDVEFCYLFGSYARKEANEKSDVDLLVSTTISGLDYYGMTERLRLALNKKVDVLGLEQINNNPELLHDILSEGIKIYEKTEE